MEEGEGESAANQPYSCSVAPLSHHPRLWQAEHVAMLLCRWMLPQPSHSAAPAPLGPSASAPAATTVTTAAGSAPSTAAPTGGSVSPEANEALAPPRISRPRDVVRSVGGPCHPCAGSSTKAQNLSPLAFAIQGPLSPLSLPFPCTAQRVSNCMEPLPCGAPERVLVGHVALHATLAHQQARLLPAPAPPPACPRQPLPPPPPLLPSPSPSRLLLASSYLARSACRKTTETRTCT